MASDQKTVDYITEHMQKAGSIRSRKMFGEYGVYCEEKVIAFICDNQLFLKITDPVRAIVRTQTVGPPYPGAKDYFVIREEDWDDIDYLSELARVTADALPVPVPKKK